MRKQRNRPGFTLMEMLVVIVIIGILTGLLFRLHSAAGERAARAQTLARIQNIKLCLEEYYRLHGEYPPGGEGTQFQGYYFRDAEYFFPDDWEKIRDYIEENNIDFMTPGVTGLLYYICAHPEVNYTRSESERWREYWDGGVGFWDGTLTWAELGDLGLPDLGSGEVTNRIFKLHDGWDVQFEYHCAHPYQSYELYSVGSGREIGRSGMVD